MVTKSSLTVIQPGGVPARAKVKPAAAGLALINEVLDADVVQAMVDADRFANQILNDHTYLGEGEPKEMFLERGPRFLERALPLHRSWLPSYARAHLVSTSLSGITSSCPCPLTQADASSMLHYLFGAMGKRRNDEAAAKLLACADIFSPTSNALGAALGLWKEVSRHPVILAITIKQLMAEKTFEPSEAELREALAKVKQRLSVHEHYVDQWLEKADRADQIVFAFDRAAWDAAYARADRETILAMREYAELGGEGPSEDLDENGDPECPPSPRWQALDDLLKAKQPKPKRIAAARKRSEAKRSI
jgi:hypothetical protein